MKMGAEFWVEHVAAAGLETIPASEYARRHGLSVPALRFPTELPKHARSAPASKFVALRVTDKVAVPSCQCTLVMPSDLRLEMPALPAPEWLVALVRAAQAAQGMR